MPSRYRCCVEADIQATGVAAKRLARRLHPDVTQSLLSLHVNTRRIRIEAGAVCVLAYGSQKKRGIREAMILQGVAAIAAAPARQRAICSRRADYSLRSA